MKLQKYLWSFNGKSINNDVNDEIEREKKTMTKNWEQVKVLIDNVTLQKNINSNNLGKDDEGHTYGDNAFETLGCRMSVHLTVI